LSLTKQVDDFDLQMKSTRESHETSKATTVSLQKKNHRLETALEAARNDIANLQV
jgi:hypothetical protein